MLFNMEHDQGHRIIAYVVPDGYSSIPTISLYSGGVEKLRCPANERRDALVSAGRHETGLCGFNIGPELAPNLANMTDLTILDAETGLLIYRRPQATRINRKVLRLETHLFPLWRFDESFSNKMQYFQRGIERFGRETVIQMFLLAEIESIYLSGRIHYRPYAYWIENGFEITIMLQDPYEELAERLLVLSLLGEQAPKYIGDRDAIRFAPAIKFAKALAFDDVRSLKRDLMDMPSDVAALLANPLTRQLTTSAPDDMPTGRSVSAALDILAACSVVGLRENQTYFTQTIAAWLNTDPAALAPTPDFPRVRPLALLLKETRAVDHLLERDTELYEAVRGACAGV